MVTNHIKMRMPFPYFAALTLRKMLISSFQGKMFKEASYIKKCNFFKKFEVQCRLLDGKNVRNFNCTSFFTSSFKMPFTVSSKE